MMVCCLAQLTAEVVPAQQSRQARQYIQMFLVVLFGRHQDKHDVHSQLIRRLEVDRLAESDQTTKGPWAPVAAKVWNGDSFAKSGTAQFFPRQQAGEYRIRPQRHLMIAQ